MSYPTAEEHGFIGYLKWLLDESEDGRAAMAHLRRGLGKPPGTAYEMDRYVLPGLPNNANSAQEEAYYLVAAIFAYWHQGKDKAESVEGSLGKSLRLMVDKEVQGGGNRDDAEKRLEKRLTALLNAHSAELPDHLRRITGLLKSKDVPVNWAQLLHDVQGWDGENRSVQHEWAKGFWVVPGKKETATIKTSETEKD